MKKATAKKAAKKTPNGQADASATASATATKPLISKEPQSKDKAAIQAGIYLHTDDNWAAAYFKDGDLHGVERKLFG